MHVRIRDAWNGWYHINGNTYGTWIRGDDRGWRSRHHREHVEGDYRNPPPIEAYAAQREASRRLMSAPVRLVFAARRRAVDEIVGSLVHQGIQVIACCVDDHHYHILAKFMLPSTAGKPTGSNPRASIETTRACVDPPWASGKTRNQPIYAYIRHVVGLAKSRSARALSESGLAADGGVWGKRFKITAVENRRHQLRTYRYIMSHEHRGAAVWTMLRKPK